MEKNPLLVANWKMNKTIEETVEFIKKIAPKITSCKIDVFLAVPFTSISDARKASEKTKIVIGAQNMNDAKKGSFTGEVASIMLKEAGAEFVILGHSERRIFFNEKNDFINRKILRAIKDDLRPILCIGETKEEKKEKLTEDILKTELVEGLKKVSKEEASNIVIAYEPVWAIGTGESAEPSIVEKTHKFIRETLKDIFDKKVSEKIDILYGGSVKPENIKSFLSKKNIDGALIGGASLDIEKFEKIIINSEKVKK